MVTMAKNRGQSRTSRPHKLTPPKKNDLPTNVSPPHHSALVHVELLEPRLPQHENALAAWRHHPLPVLPGEAGAAAGWLPLELAPARTPATLEY